MPKAAFHGLPHSESEVYCVKSSAIGRKPTVEYSHILRSPDRQHR